MDSSPMWSGEWDPGTCLDVVVRVCVDVLFLNNSKFSVKKEEGKNLTFCIYLIAHRISTFQFVFLFQPHFYQNISFLIAIQLDG